MSWTQIARTLAARGAPFFVLGPGGTPARGFVALVGWRGDALLSLGPQVGA